MTYCNIPMMISDHNLGGFDAYFFEQLDLLFEENFQPLLCSNFDEGKDMIFPEHDFCDKNFHPYPFSPYYSSIYMVGIPPHDNHLPIGQSYFQPMVCCGDFQFHTHDRKALGWEQFFSLGMV
jgi:hypothetical protein